MDNFFTSPALFMDLLQDGIYACGTVRSNRRGFPQDLKGETNLEEQVYTLYTHTYLQAYTLYIHTHLHTYIIITLHI
ncbi:hypothetical protein GBAR_LOCUS21 [Geodia barretti]|uniref:PiggyBac transposable element-derived protein domain-containing protein n=1 Tax=Geodia barretti TaxID=519541 RepID=A0AA35VX27_GEOBA|nr:hypothetical protein GBAR_LOCUS21 [Geodia barretti]